MYLPWDIYFVILLYNTRAVFVKETLIKETLIKYSAHIMQSDFSKELYKNSADILAYVKGFLCFPDGKYASKQYRKDGRSAFRLIFALQIY